MIILSESLNNDPFLWNTQPCIYYGDTKIGESLPVGTQGLVATSYVDWFQVWIEGHDTWLAHRPGLVAVASFSSTMKISADTTRALGVPGRTLWYSSKRAPFWGKKKAHSMNTYEYHGV